MNSPTPLPYSSSFESPRDVYWRTNKKRSHEASDILMCIRRDGWKSTEACAPSMVQSFFWKVVPQSGLQYPVWVLSIGVGTKWMPRSGLAHKNLQQTSFLFFNLIFGAKYWRWQSLYQPRSLNDCMNHTLISFLLFPITLPTGFYMSGKQTSLPVSPWDFRAYRVQKTALP